MSLARPHFSQPFMRTSTGVVCVEQDTPEHIRACWFTVTACPTGAFVPQPEFGWDQPLMRTMPVDFSGLLDALKRFEPRDQNVGVAQVETLLGEIVEVGDDPRAITQAVVTDDVEDMIFFDGGGGGSSSFDGFIDGGGAVVISFGVSIDGDGA